VTQIMSAVFAAIALYIAGKNLGGIRRGQALEAQMNLISLENELRRNHIQYETVLKKWLEGSPDTDGLMNAFELYMTSADKLAALINEDYLHKQFPNRNWEDEYKEIFLEAKRQNEGNRTIIPGREQMIRNINKVLMIKWGLLESEINQGIDREM
jgi:hypothetical protein